MIVFIALDIIYVMKNIYNWSVFGWFSEILMF